jgi:dephospho-CoA kinase
MFILGLTGSLGMGKSTTARFFIEEGVPVHDADAVVHRLYEGEAVAAIEAAFPGTTADGKVDRNELAARVLGDHAALKRLEALFTRLCTRLKGGFWPRRRRGERRLRCWISRSCSRLAAMRGSTRWWWCRHR